MNNQTDNSTGNINQQLQMANQISQEQLPVEEQPKPEGQEPKPLDISQNPIITQELPEEKAKEEDLTFQKYYPPEAKVDSLNSSVSSVPFVTKSPPNNINIRASQIIRDQGDAEIKVVNKRALNKLAVFILVILIFGSAATATVTRYYTDRIYRAAKGVLYSAPLKTTVWQSYGSVPEAALVLPLQTPNGRIDQEFLLDTGAVVSSLPREMADKIGYDLAKLQRQTFKGFGNTTSFAYNAEMIVHFDKKEITLPVVFTEAQGSKALLGRKGLIDKFTILVDHKTQMVEIRE